MILSNAVNLTRFLYAGVWYGIWLYQFLIIAYLFIFNKKGVPDHLRVAFCAENFKVHRDI